MLCCCFAFYSEELLSEDPFIVKLKFEPSGRPESQQDYYLTAKENICVVCGRTESYIRYQARSSCSHCRGQSAHKLYRAMGFIGRCVVIGF